MRFTVILLLFYSCQIDSGFKDLTPENNFNSTFFFDSPEFTRAIANVGKAEADTVFAIDRPEHLLPPALHAIEKGWMTTDTFAFETSDFQDVLNVITHTAESHRDSIITSIVSPKPAQISLDGKAAFSIPGQYYLVPLEISTGETIFLQITRSKSSGNSFWTKWYYTANGLWMIGEEKQVKADEDVS